MHSRQKACKDLCLFLSGCFKWSGKACIITHQSKYINANIIFSLLLGCCLMPASIRFNQTAHKQYQRWQFISVKLSQILKDPMRIKAMEPYLLWVTCTLCRSDYAKENRWNAKQHLSRTRLLCQHTATDEWEMGQHVRDFIYLCFTSR